MNARKGWLLGTALVVITLLSLGWFMLVQPPFRFLRGAERIRFYVGKSYAPNITECYWIKGPYNEIALRANTDLRKVGFGDPGSDAAELTLFRGRESVSLHQIEDYVYVYILRKPTPLDRLRLLLFRKGP